MKIRMISGFSLIECMISLAMTGLMAIVLISFVGQLIDGAARSCRRVDAGIELFTALSVLARDIQGASSNVESWRLIDKRVLGLPSIYWQLSRGTLMRREGGASAVVVCALDDFSYKIDAQGKRVVGVFVCLGKGKLMIKKYVCLQEMLACNF